MDSMGLTRYMSVLMDDAMKQARFFDHEFVIDKDYDAVLRHKLSRFGASVSHRKAIHLTMVTTYGVAHNAYWNRVQSEVVADDLFSE